MQRLSLDMVKQRITLKLIKYYDMKSWRNLALVGLLLTYGSLALAQNVELKPRETQLDNTAKCDASTQVWLMNQSKQKGHEEARLLAKVTETFDASQLKVYGIKVGSRAGNVVTLRVPLDKMWVINNCSDILQYSISRRVYPTTDQVRFDTRTDSVQAGEGLPQAFNGEGVLIGITDWGFDYKHPNYNNNGEDNRRLLRAWDQFKLAGPAPEGFDYGTEIDNRHDLLQAMCDTSNFYGHHTHGTHVAGIAAGRGIDGQYTGQAPYAKLLFSSFQLDEMSWVDAVNWMKNVSKEENKRLVVNSSWGMYTFSTLDGTSLLSQAINSLTDSGIVFVSSAGNNGDANFHISRTFTSTPDTLKTIPNNSILYTGQAGNALILWGEPNKSFKATIALVNGGVTYSIPWFNTADGNKYLDSCFVIGNDSIQFDLTIEESNPFSHRPHMLFNVISAGNSDLHLMITANDGTIHAWNVCNLESHAGNMGINFESGNLQGYSVGDPSYGVGEPACAEGTISVAAHAADSRNLVSGAYQFGNAANFSSEGPIIDGRRKPEISAPGVNVVSSLNSHCDPEHRVSTSFSFSHGGTNYTWGRMSGTSMSGPAVTGIVALMLQANPTISPRHIRDIICQTARNDERTGDLIANDSISNKWGWGKIDALRAVNAALAHVSVDNINEQWMNQSLQVSPNPASNLVLITTGRFESLPLEIYNMNGQLIYQQQVSLETQVDISQWSKGIYVVRCGGRTTKIVK